MLRPIGVLIPALVLVATISPRTSFAQEPLDDLEMAHVAVVASQIDISYAHMALALSSDPEVRSFAETMIRHHTAVNEQVFELARRLGVEAKDNPMSRQLEADARITLDRLSRLRGASFDEAYAANELQYHRTVNGVVEDTFLPNIVNGEVAEAFRAALETFRRHEDRAASLVQAVGARS